MLSWLDNSFQYPFWVYVSIPIGAALIGWVTKILAVKMMFDPVEFKGIRPVFGWQGIVPRKAAKMASVSVDSITSKILQPQDMFERIDSDAMFEQLSDPLRGAARELVDTIMLSYQPQLWRAAPDQLKDLVVANVEERMPAATGRMIEQMRGQIDQFLDIKHMAVAALVRDKAMLNSIFKDISRPAFTFLIRSGFVSGFLIGLVQMVVFGVTGWHLALPLFGLLTGGLTDYVALQLIFRPVERRTILPGIKWQGVFLARRDEVIRGYSALLAREIFTPRTIMEHLLTGPMSDKFLGTLQSEIERTIDEEMGFAGRVIGAVGGKRYQDVKRKMADHVIDRMPETADQIERFAGDQLDIEAMMIEKMSEMDAKSFENLLRPAFKDDEWLIVVVGAALGFLCGELQSQLILLFAR